MIYETVLPVFPGFNNTLFTPNILPEVNSINQIRRAMGHKEIRPEACRFDYDQYKLQVAKAACNYIGKQLSNWKFIESLKFDRIENDKIHVKITASAYNVTNLMEFAKKHNATGEVNFEFICRNIGIDEHHLYYNIETSISAVNYNELVSN